MKTATVNISFRKDLLKMIDDVAQKEARSRSELVREAARMYIDRKMMWEAIFKYGQKTAARKGLTEAKVKTEITAYRKLKKKFR